MSPMSDAIEKLARRHGVNALEALEFWLERAAIRQHEGGMTQEQAEEAALGDLETWIQLDIRINGEVGPQLTLKGGK